MTGLRKESSSLLLFRIQSQTMTRNARPCPLLPPSPQRHHWGEMLLWSKRLQGQIAAKNQAKEMEETVPETTPDLAIVFSCPDCIWGHLPSPHLSYLHRPPFGSLLINLHQAAVTGCGPRSALISDPSPRGLHIILQQNPAAFKSQSSQPLEMGLEMSQAPKWRETLPWLPRTPAIMIKTSL